jgi:hypothetical protein
VAITLSHLAGWIDTALKKDPPKEILEICDEYYSPYYYFMYLAAFAVSGVAVELGVETGRGSASVALAGKRVFGIDTNKRSNIDTLQARFSKFVFLNQPSLPVPEAVRQLPVSLLHIDTEHSYAMAKAEFEAYQPYLSRPAVVVFDDLHAAENDVLRYFMGLPYPKIQDDRMHPETGWGVMLYG